jgi:hypothetical protein
MLDLEESIQENDELKSKDKSFVRHPHYIHHIWWKIRAAIVRRRWLRPIVPVLVSPIVALYCRAHKLLYKKGVARRGRWACSFCWRRAILRCAQCKRSSYCSRQCHQDSWHLLHKQVCYNPIWWAWSAVVYSIATLLAFPGIRRDPLMYDLGSWVILLSFYTMAILEGGIATALKKSVRLKTFRVEPLRLQ